MLKSSVTALGSVEVDTKELDPIEAVIKKNSAGIDELLNKQELKAKQMTDFFNHYIRI